MVSDKHEQHAWGVTPQQRKQCQFAYQTNAPEWHAFANHAEARLLECLPEVLTLDDALIPQLHHMANQSLHEFFPHTRPNQKSHDSTFNNIVLNKWQHRRALMRLTTQTMPNMFQAWMHLARFARLNRQSKQHAKTVRQQRFDEVIHSASQAAQRHDSKTLFAIINKFSPKIPMRKMQLRNPQGHIASPIEEAALLKKHVMDTWRGPCTFPTAPHHSSGMPFTMEDLEKELSQMPVSKAVARPCAPAPVWRMLAPKLAPPLHALLTHWWDRPEPFIPSWFRDAWMLLIPKPNKSPTTPGALRPLALQEPISKCIVGLLTKSALREAFPVFCQMPLWAYLPGRSTQEALLRVSRHCHLARTLTASSKSTPFTRQQGITRCRLAGGLQLFLDIEKAFDGVCREKLFSRLGEAGINPQTVLLLSHWHQNTHYHINCNGEDTPVSGGCGVRQGCRAAPLLWTGYMWLFLLELTKETSPRWVTSCLNVYADDYQMGDVFHSLDELQQLMNNITKTMQLLKRFGLLINPNKCTALLTMSGSISRRTRTQLTAWREGKEWLQFSGNDQDAVWIPIASKATYLGAVMSYAKFEDQTVKHRVQLSRIAFTRLRKWLTGKRGLRKQQRLSLFTTCVYPIMTYGIFPIGLTTFGLKHIQQHMYCMLRQILCNHAYITGQSHQQALALNHVDPPLAWLLTSIDSLQRSLHQRLASAYHNDIICLLDWRHLETLRSQIDWQLHTGPEQLVQPGELDVPTTVHTCLQCQYATTDIAQFRKHCTTMHAQPMARSQPADHKQYMHQGLPQCKFCQQTFHRRTFHMHIQRGCQVLIAGPSSCWLDPAPPLDADPARPPEMFSAKQDAPVRGTTVLTDSDLRDILNQEWGRRILTIVGNRTWHHMRKETAASTYLANRCCLCDQFLGRTQDLNRHYKLHHPEFWPHIQAKGAQLTNLYGEETPCAFCGALFKACHQCPVWVQMAMMLIYGGGIQSDGTHESPAQRCEICMEQFQTSEALHAHLVTEHRLPSLSFNAARDTLDGEPVCAHCLTMYDNAESLRSHISQGRCLSFNPELPTEVLEVRQQWIDALGKLADTLRDPHVRMQLTLQCQNCRCRYSRASDLSGHLQASHDKIWSKAQGLTGILVELLYNETGCICNPNIGNYRAHHVCVPLRQLAILFTRLPDPLLYPHVPTETELAQMFSKKLDREHRFLLERAMTGDRIEALWKDPPIVDILRHHCVLCAAELNPADLVIHMHEVHHCGQPIVRLLMQQLMSRYMLLQANDFQCYACDQVFNLPEDEAKPSSCDRQLPVQAHFRAQCPNLLQTAIILSKAAHGRHGRRGHERVHGDERTDLDGVPTHGTIYGQDSQAGTERCTTQKAKKRRTGPTDPQQAHGQQRKSGPRNVSAGKTGAQAGQGHAADEERGHLHLLFRQQRARQLPQSAHADDRDMGQGTPDPTTRSAEDADAPLAPQADASGFQHSADQVGPASHSTGGIGPEDPGLADTGPAAGWNMPLLGMGHTGKATEGESEETTHAETPPPDLHRHAGGSERRPPGDAIPCLTDDQQSRRDAS